jgi:DNA polymerase-1
MNNLAQELPEVVPMKIDAGTGKSKPEARLLLQVHDELVFEVKTQKVREFARKIKKIMESAYQLEAPIIVEAKQGQNWEEMKKIQI